MKYKDLIIVDRARELNFKIEGAEIVSAKRYLTEEAYQNLNSARVFNFCSNMSYQGFGYYVSLLAQARKHRIMPSPMTIQDLKSPSIRKVFSTENAELIQRKLKKIKAEKFELSIYFGQNMAQSYEELAHKIFAFYQAPLLRITFEKEEGQWEISAVKVLTLKDVPQEHWPFMAQAASEYFSARPYRLKGQKQYNYDLAILHNPEDPTEPSNARALKKFIKVGNELGMYVELITKDDANRLLEFDALFIRETTNVNHHTYRMARKAEAEGLIVIDDPESILRCSNKVYLEEMLKLHHIPRPKTAILHKDNVDEVFELVGKNGPSILKSPDSAFSKGVYKVADKLEFYAKAAELLKRSDLVIAQEYVPTDFDWRIGVLNNRFLFACKYFMAQGHWQIVKNDNKGECDFGDFEAVPIDHVPEKILKTALSAANIIGKGLYGVDIKQSGKKVYLIEVNDNPNIDAGVEDVILGDELYYKVMGHFLYLLNKQRKINGP